MLRRLMFGVAIALSLAVSTPSNATTALALNIDGSGSISAADFALQKQGYINALNDLYTNNPNLYGQNAIGIWQFAHLRIPSPFANAEPAAAQVVSHS